MIDFAEYILLFFKVPYSSRPFAWCGLKFKFKILHDNSVASACRTDTLAVKNTKLITFILLQVSVKCIANSLPWPLICGWI